MSIRRIGPWLTATTLVVAAAVILFNLEPYRVRHEAGSPSRTKPTKPAGKSREVASPQQPGVMTGSLPRKYPIGLDLQRNRLKIAARWLPAVPLEGLPPPGPGEISLEAHVHASEGNPHGFAGGEWVPYLSVRYSIEPAAGGRPLEGVLRPVVAAQGPHYGARVSMPGPGDYRLTFLIDPPSAGTLARLVDPVAGVAPWWEPFKVSFDWPYHPG